ncbi:hypothetical protein IFM89_002083 [Coptis chinensis]|uniref:Ubiquitin thioesterase OTU n=1 Tax=Coptis chinensis TaxID=261450 RepID=A0A835LD54_9MAGN|nr:hypothetical protein IFM89_002083 [Coptis chinensis]
MQGALLSRFKPWFLLLALTLAHSATQYRQPLFVRNNIGDDEWRSDQSTVAPIWHAIQPTKLNRRIKHPRQLLSGEHGGRGSTNINAGSDSALLLLGVFACLSYGGNHEESAADNGGLVAADGSNSAAVGDGTNKRNRRKKISKGKRNKNVSKGTEEKNSSNYKVIGVPADGRCLFRALAHGSCLRNGEAAPDEDRQRELADDLRARVVDELVKRRTESEWFIEGDFDAYLKSIKQPRSWGGEPELLMASYVLQTPISVFMLDEVKSAFVNVANYGEELEKDGKTPIMLLFHGYGHYDLLETPKQKPLQD